MDKHGGQKFLLLLLLVLVAVEINALNQALGTSASTTTSVISVSSVVN
jgi:hypothetical protein